VLWRGAETRRVGVVIAEAWASFWRVLLPVLLVAWPVMLFFWPWAQQSPLLNPVRAIIYFSHEIFPFPTLFAGEYIPATNLPWAYLPVHIALALPELVLTLLVIAPVGAVVKWFKSEKGFGFVEMSNDAEAERAINSLNGKELSGRALNVNEARPREDRPRPYGANRFAGNRR